MSAADQTEQIDLAKAAAELGLYTQKDTAATAFARLLVLGAPKIGKTTAIATTAPDPLFINCDGDSALKFPAKKGAKYIAVDAFNRPGWNQAILKAGKAVSAGLARTVVVDTITLLADNLLDDISLAGIQGFERFGTLADSLLGGIKKLFRLEAHVILVAHMVPDVETSSGVVPLIAGQAKVKVPALAHDCALFELDLETGARSFALGPQRFWSYAGRNVKRSCMVQPTIPAVFEELGIAL